MFNSSNEVHFSLSLDDYAMHYLPVELHSNLTQWIAWLRSRRVKRMSGFVRDGGQL